MAMNPSTQQLAIGGVVILVVVILVCCIFAPWRTMGAVSNNNKQEPKVVEDAAPPVDLVDDEGEDTSVPPDRPGLDQSTRMQENDLDEKREAQLHRQALMLPSGRRHQMAAPTTGALVMASMRSRDNNGGRKLHNPSAGYNDSGPDMDNVQPASVGSYLTTL